MIITGRNKVITKILLKDTESTELIDSLDSPLADINSIPFNSKSPDKIAAIYKGTQLIWLTTYEINIKSCYGSGVWLDNYNWIDNDLWKDS